MLPYDSILQLSEEHMISQRSKHELMKAIQARYLKAKKGEKQRMLDEFTATTGYHRKYAIRILKHGYKRRQGKPKGRQKIYTGEVVKVLKKIWRYMGGYVRNVSTPIFLKG